MFTTVVAYAAFIMISLLFIALLWEGLRPKSELEEVIERMRDAERGYTTRASWLKVGTLIAIWFAAGYYLWG